MALKKDKVQVIGEVFDAARLRSFLASYPGGLMGISHDVGLLEATVNKVFHLDANRAELDV